MREWPRQMTRSEFLAFLASALFGSMAGCSPEGTGTAVVPAEAKKRLKPGADVDAGDGKKSSKKKGR